MVKSILNLKHRRGFFAIISFFFFLFILALLYILFSPMIDKGITKIEAKGVPSSWTQPLKVSWKYFPQFAIFCAGLWTLATAAFRERLSG